MYASGGDISSAMAVENVSDFGGGGCGRGGREREGHGLEEEGDE
jgi:hypothetical protein